ncbi:protein LSM12 homolog [Rhipicephalus sanguineus]|uniref:AD domain-containing protein n=2 Tax=Rhipicephalus TaxID=426455 RepID=L7M508_RHIPC|nr:protein LSM12 homolog [Rhipicephalus sanguineus]
MKAMADGPECFSLGSVVCCKTCYDQVIEGEVLAFDQQTKALMLKCASSSGKANVSDIRMVNLNFVSELTVKKEAGSSPLTPPQPLNTEKLNTRAKQNIDERQRLAAAISAGVSHDGIRLFLAIRKTIDDVTWQGKNIIVMNQVTIVPPYRPENCKGKSDSDASVLHVRKIVEKHLRDQQKQSQGTRQTSPTQPSTKA